MPFWTLKDSVQLLLLEVFIRGPLHSIAQNHEIHTHETVTNDVFWAFMRVLFSNSFAIPYILCHLLLNRQHRGHSKRKLQFIQ
jgi:hypothetical protein